MSRITKSCGLIHVPFILFVDGGSMQVAVHIRMLNVLVDGGAAEKNIDINTGECGKLSKFKYEIVTVRFCSLCMRAESPLSIQPPLSKRKRM